MKALDLTAKKVEFVNEKGESDSFLSFKTYGKNGQKLDVRFTKSCPKEKLPTKSCIIKVEDEDLIVDERTKFTVVWVKDIQEVVEYNAQNKIEKYFD